MGRTKDRKPKAAPLFVAHIHGPGEEYVFTRDAPAGGHVVASVRANHEEEARGILNDLTGAEEAWTLETVFEDEDPLRALLRAARHALNHIRDGDLSGIKATERELKEAIRRAEPLWPYGDGGKQ
jgi:hypothetical protein